MTKQEILKEFELFSLCTGGIGDWLTEKTDDDVFERLATIDSDPLSKVQLNQLLVLGHEAPVSDGFFDYYWLRVPKEHPYDVTDLPDYEDRWKTSGDKILSLKHLRWGLYRLFTDGLLAFGNVRTAFRSLRPKTYEELRAFFKQRCFDTEIRKRGPALLPVPIPKQDRYLVSEMVRKALEDRPEEGGKLAEALVGAYKSHGENTGRGRAPTVRAGERKLYRAETSGV